MPTATLSLPPLRDHVRTARLVAVAAARRAGLPEADVDDVRLAVGEAVARAVLRHESAGIPTPVEVAISDDGREFAVTVADVSATGTGTSASDRVAPDEPTVDDAHQDDYALALLAALAPSVHETSSPDGTSLSMAWPLTAAA